MFSLILCTALVSGYGCNPVLPTVTISPLTKLECLATLEAFERQIEFVAMCVPKD